MIQIIPFPLNLNFASSPCFQDGALAGGFSLTFKLRQYEREKGNTAETQLKDNWEPNIC